MFRKLLKFGFVGTVGLTTAAYVFPDQFTPVQKVINVGVAGAQVFYVYKYKKDKTIEQKNMQAASYLRDALRKNGGLYLKLGQLIATLDVIVPDEYRDIMGTLTRDCPTSSYQKVKKTFEQQTGFKIDEYFQEFQKEPISSASIGQVHYAKLKSGQQVAVKVQHRQLSKNVQYDLKLMTFFVKLANMAFEDFKYNWLLEQFSRNIRIQLDFVHQAKNINRLAELIKRWKLQKLAVPKVLPPTTKKILMMEFIHGYHVDEIQEMKKKGINLKEVGKLFSNLVIKMIHREGFVHADPHAGNLKVRINKKNEPQLVILDHGLYQQLQPQVRKAYNKFWLGLILNDESIYGPSAKQLGASNPKVLCSMLTSKTQDQLNDPNRKIFDLNPTEDRVKILAQAKKNQDKIVNTLNELRRQILLLLKVNEFARTIQNMLGGRQFGVYQDIAQQCVQSLEASWYSKWLLYLKMKWAN